MTELVLRMRQAMRGRSQAAIADAAGVGQRTVSSYLTGQTLPRADFLAAIAEQFDISPTWLLLGEGPMRLSDSLGASDAAAADPVTPGQAAALLREAARNLRRSADQLEAHARRLA